MGIITIILHRNKNLSLRVFSLNSNLQFHTQGKNHCIKQCWTMNHCFSKPWNFLRDSSCICYKKIDHYIYYSEMNVIKIHESLTFKYEILREYYLISNFLEQVKYIYCHLMGFSYLCPTEYNLCITMYFTQQWCSVLWRMWRLVTHKILLSMRISIFLQL